MIEVENKKKKDGKKPIISARITSRRKSAPSTFSEPERLTDSLSWPKEDIEKLLSRMKQHIPPSDHMRHQSRAQHLPWDLIEFNGYTSLECQHMWKLVLQRVRGFRILQEVLSDAEEWLKQPWTDFYASKLKNRHPDRPKKPPSSFMLFYKDQIKIVREEFPKLTVVEIAKIASEKYANLKAKEKAKYIKRSKLASEEYNRNMGIFLAEHPSEMSKTDKLSKNKHHKKITPFNLYMEDQLYKDPDMGEKAFKELFSFYRHQWDELSEEDKLPWLHWAEQKQHEILQSNSNETVCPAKSVLTKKEQEICDRANGKPTKPPMSVYNLFCKMMFKSGELLEYPSKDRMKEMSLRWQSIDPEDRLALEKQLKKEKKQYDIQLEEYLKRNPTLASSVEEKSQKLKKNKKTKQNEKEKYVAEDNQSDSLEAAYLGNKQKEWKHTKGKSAEEDFGFLNMNGHVDKSNAELLPKKKNKKGKDNLIPPENIPQSCTVEEIPAKKKKKHTKHNDELVLEETDSFVPVDITKKKSKRKRELEEEQPEKPVDITNKKNKRKRELETPISEQELAKEKKKSERTLSETDLQEILDSSTTEKTVMIGEPKPPPKLPIKFFAKAMKKQKIKFASDEDLDRAWNNLPSKERKFYKKSLKEVKETYLSEYKSFLISLSPKSLRKYIKLRNAAGK